MSVSLSSLAREMRDETAFAVLAAARKLKAAGKRVIELEIGDSPFPTTAAAKYAGTAAIAADQSHYCPSVGIAELRQAAADYVRGEHGVEATADNVVVGHGAKVFELLFCEAFLNPGDGVLVFGPYFPTYLPNIARRGARVWLCDLKQQHEFRPNLAEVRRFLDEDPRPKAIFLNSPHNPTGGVATEDDLRGLADLVRGRDVAVLSDEPYDQMVWSGRHHSLLAQPGMFEHCVSAYTFSKSYSMSGWRIGFAIANPQVVEVFARLLNTSLSCTAPIVQLAAAAALRFDADERDRTMRLFGEKVKLLAGGLRQIPGIRCLEPAGTFYVFPGVQEICNRLSITSHGLAMYLLEAADDQRGVACLGGECFGPAGAGFLRFSCAEPDDMLREAIDFLPTAFGREERVRKYLDDRPHYRLETPYAI